jgi:hypothetical protein
VLDERAVFLFKPTIQSLVPGQASQSCPLGPVVGVGVRQAQTRTVHEQLDDMFENGLANLLHGEVALADAEGDNNVRYDIDITDIGTFDPYETQRPERASGG